MIIDLRKELINHVKCSLIAKIPSITTGHER